MLSAFARDGFLPVALGRLSARQVPANAIIVHALIAIGLAVTGTFEELVVLSSLAGCALYIGGCAAAYQLRRRDIALAGTPMRLPLLGVWVALGIGSMAACVALGSWPEIMGPALVVVGSMLLYRMVGQRA